MTPEAGIRAASPYVLTLLTDVAWHGTPIAGERSQALLALLARHPRDGVATEHLIDALWCEAPPANPTKALQVVVSRVRAATSADAVVRTPRGYRLGLAAGEVDVLRLAALAKEARALLDAGDAAAAQQSADEALRLSGEPGRSGEDTPLGALRAAASAQLREARRITGIALSKAGDHDAALGPLRTAVHSDPADEPLLAHLLRSEAAVRGAGAALEAYERYRARLAERTGSDPGPELRAVHAELLRADHPVREGVRYDATELLGRDADLRALRMILRSARVTSIVGPGGLGKTRIAHVLGRDADQPVVHVVELVAVAAPEDVVGELGSMLGIRDSVGGRAKPSPEQRADVRSRIAVQLDAVPTLLILDNCEHVVAAVAELVAFLVATTSNVRVLTTSRAPLAIASERVYALDQLGADDAAELFRQRAASARPAAALPEGAVTDVVRRLDGLPLAIELAAAKVRVMSVEDIAARLQDRFALLRGGDRSAPDRHQTLLAVIDWSWNLLTERDRAALRRLSVFHDGFTLAAAESVLGADPLEAVQSLVDQSLVTVRDSGTSVRYGMLETVREFGRMRLADAGEEADALVAQRIWARRYLRDAGTVLFGRGQVAAMDALRAEEANLSDVLRGALAEPDPGTVIVLLSGLGGFWTVCGQHERLMAIHEAVEQSLAGWAPPPELRDDARLALSTLATARFMLDMDQPSRMWELLRELGPDSELPHVASLAAVTLACDPEDEDRRSRLLALTESSRPLTAAQALATVGHQRENAGDAEGAIAMIERALELTEDDEGPWFDATLRTQLAQLHGQVGRYEQSAAHAAHALPVLDRLAAADDAAGARMMLAAAAIVRGDLDEAERHTNEVREAVRRHSMFGENVILAVVEAELLVAKGDSAGCLRRYRQAVEDARTLRVPGFPEPTGMEPWNLFVRSASLTAHVLYGSGEDGADLVGPLITGLKGALASEGDAADLPVAGLMLYALALWGLVRRALPADGAVRLAVLADRFDYNRMLPSMVWDHLAAPAEHAAPGVLDAIRAEYGERRGKQLLPEARTTVATLLPD